MNTVAKRAVETTFRARCGILSSYAVATAREILLPMLSGMVIVAGCSSQSDSGGGGTGIGRAQVRIAHAASVLPTFDVCWDDDVVIEGATFRTITAYSRLTAGTYRIAGIAPGGDCDEPLTATRTATYAHDRDYTTVLLEGFAPLSLLDDNSPVPQGRCRIRLINGSPDSESLSVEEAVGATILAGIDYNDQRDYQTYVEIAALTYNLVITSPALDAEPFEMGLVNLEEGRVYTLFATGEVSGPTPFDVILVEDANPGTER